MPRLGLRLLVAWPVLVFTAVNACWIAAALSLGHLPRPSADDPKSINTTVSALYYAAVLLLVSSPLATLASVGALLTGLAARMFSASWMWSPKTLGYLAVSSLLWTVFWVLMRIDPYHVVAWLGD